MGRVIMFFIIMAIVNDMPVEPVSPFAGKGGI
jgi:hypothetical protein